MLYKRSVRAALRRRHHERLRRRLFNERRHSARCQGWSARPSHRRPSGDLHRRARRVVADRAQHPGRVCCRPCVAGGFRCALVEDGGDERAVEGAERDALEAQFEMQAKKESQTDHLRMQAIDVAGQGFGAREPAAEELASMQVEVDARRILRLPRRSRAEPFRRVLLRVGQYGCI